MKASLNVNACWRLLFRNGLFEPALFCRTSICSLQFKPTAPFIPQNKIPMPQPEYKNICTKEFLWEDRALSCSYRQQTSAV